MYLRSFQKASRGVKPWETTLLNSALWMTNYDPVSCLQSSQSQSVCLHSIANDRKVNVEVATLNWKLLPLTSKATAIPLKGSFRQNQLKSKIES